VTRRRAVRRPSADRDVQLCTLTVLGGHLIQHQSRVQMRIDLTQGQGGASMQ